MPDLYNRYYSNYHVVIQRVADVLLYPTLENSHYEQHGTATGNPTTSTLRVYKHPAGAVPSNLCADQHPEFAILISSNAADSTRSSKLYFGRPCLDFQQDKRHDLLILNDMRCLNYESSLKKPSEKDLLRHMDPEGGPDMWDLMTEDLKISLVDYEGRSKFNFFKHVDGLETDRYHFRSYRRKLDGSAHRLATSD